MKVLSILKEKMPFIMASVRRRPRKWELISTIEYLWQIIDDIDTASDMAKYDNKEYRNIVEKKQKLRWKTGITTDGYKLNYDNIKIIDISSIKWL